MRNSAFQTVSTRSVSFAEGLIDSTRIHDGVSAQGVS